MTQKIYSINIFFCIDQKFVLLKNTFKVTLRYLFNVFFLTFNTVSYPRFNFKLKIDPEKRIFKNLKEIWKPGKNFENMSGNPEERKD